MIASRRPVHYPSLLLLAALLSALFSPAPAARAASTFVVTTTNDSGPGSLRDAIAQANATAGADTITFNISGSGVQTIAPFTALPAITDPVLIDGLTQPGASCTSWPPTLRVQLSGINYSTSEAAAALTFSGAASGGSSVRGLVITGFYGSGNSGGIAFTDSSNNAVECNYIGTNPDGVSVPFGNNQQNAVGVSVVGAGSTNNRVGSNGDGVNDTGERNVISGNANGVSFQDGTGNILAGNYVGTDATGTQQLGNSSQLVVLFNTSGNRIGTSGTSANPLGERNIIVGNESIYLVNANNNVIAGNYVGTDVTGTQPFSNSTDVYVTGDGNTIGLPGAGNLLAASSQAGVWIVSGANNVVQSNLIGTNAAGAAALGNRLGVYVSGGTNTRIGTNADGVNDAAERNVISGNTLDGIQINDSSVSGTVVAGNLIGTDAAGTAALGNTNVGVFVAAGTGTVIGGTPAAARNIISANKFGVVANAAGTVVLGNSIGTNAAGTAALGNTQDAAQINADNVIVSGNLVAGNGTGLTISGNNAVIQGNLIGTDASGTSALSTGSGITLFGSGALVGGTSAAQRNVISGNADNGIVLYSPAGGTRIYGNYIGTDRSGTSALGNSTGILIGSLSGQASQNNQIGGAAPGQGNVISGNSSVALADSADTTNITVQGNKIGTDVSGTIALGNGANALQLSGSRYTIGGINPGEANTIANNSGAGVLLLAGAANNTIRGNSISNNTDRGIIAPNIPFPFVTRSVPSGATLRTVGVLTGTVGTAYTLDFYANQICDPSFFGEGQRYLGSQTVAIGPDGAAAFDLSFTPTTAVPFGEFVTVAATSPSGATSSFSNCASAGPGNDAWPRAYQLNSGVNFSQPLDLPGQTRWFTVPAPPGTRVALTLTGTNGGPLPFGYDVAVFKDIGQAFSALTNPQDLTRLSAEFADDGFNGDRLAPDALNSVQFAPQAFSPQAFSPQAFSPQAFSPQAFSPQAFSPQAFSPQAFSPQAFSPQAFSPQAFSPQAFSPQAFSPEQQAYASAQSRSLIAVAAQPDSAPRSLTLNTWNNSGSLYIQVRGQNGAFTPLAPFQIQATVLSGVCQNLQLIAGVDAGASGSYRTVILADLSRIAGTAAELGGLQTRLATLASREGGVIIDTGSAVYANVLAARAQVAANPGCPTAQTQLAEKIKALYRNVSGVQYIVIAGTDDAIPFFRSPDNAPLGPESNYDPPLVDSSTAQAALRLNYILSQDPYGARTTLAFGNTTLPVPQIPVGRLVQTAAQINTVLDAYLNLSGGTLPAPSSALVTSYDFLVDAGNAVTSDLTAGLGTGARVDTLTSPNTQSFLDPNAWTANQLRASLFGSRHDLVFLAGHFSAAGTLAADFRTAVSASEVTTATNSFTNTIVWSAGCHSGYDLAEGAAIPGVTRTPSWSAAFASRGATLIAGSGYQYGDTDFVAYSERIYTEFSRQLRVGSSPVAIGDALVAAKRAYLQGTPHPQGIDDKSVRIVTIYGLPMLKVNLPSGRLPAPTNSGSGIAPTVVPNGPGSNPLVTLRSADLTGVPTGATLQPPVTLTNVDSPSQTVQATYYRGPDGQALQPSQPVLPLKRVSVGVPNLTLRGVGFRGGDYTDETNVRPLVSAATYDLRGVKQNFAPPVFWPLRPWTVNYFGALADPANGATELQLTPTQYRTAQPTDQTGTRRVFSSLDVRLFYSGVYQPFSSGSNPALSDAPTIARVTSTLSSGSIGFALNVTGDPAAGVQAVWVTWTDPTAPNPRWQSLDLTQSAVDSTRWTGTLSGVNVAAVQFMAQAVNAFGLVSVSDNLGAYYGAGANPGTPPATTTQAATSIALSAAGSAAYGTRVTVQAQLSSGGAAQSGQRLIFSLAGQTKPATTDASGAASASFALTGPPGSYQASASFAGSPSLAPSAANGAFNITKRNTLLGLSPASASVAAGANSGIGLTLTDDAGGPLALRTLMVQVSGANGAQTVAVTTNALGQGALGTLNLPTGSYSIAASFGTPQPDPTYNPSSGSGSLTLTAASSAPTISSAPVLTAVQGKPYSYQVSASGTPALSFSLVSAPTGMTINPTSGLIGWTPLANPGSYAVTVRASNSGGSAAQSFSVQLFAPGGPFPASGVLDSFTRANGGVGSAWEGMIDTSFYRITGNRLEVRLGGPLVWKATFGTTQEAYVRLSSVDRRSVSQGLLLKTQLGSVPAAGAIVVVYDALARAVRVSTVRLGAGVWTVYTGPSVTFQNGDLLGARALANGTVQIYRNGSWLATVTLTAADQAFFNGKGGRIGVWTVLAANAALDDFGGGNVTP